MTYRITLLSFGAFLLATPAHGADLQQAGEATRTMMFTDCYTVSVHDTDGKLTQADLDAPDNPVRIEILAKYGGDKPDIPKGWSEELVPELPDGDWSDLQDAYGKLGEGDTVTVDFEPGSGTTVTHNGKTIAQDPGYGLAKNTLDIWLGDTPVDDGMKEELLGG